MKLEGLFGLLYILFLTGLVIYAYLFKDVKDVILSCCMLTTVTLVIAISERTKK